LKPSLYRGAYRCPGDGGGLGFGLGRDYGGGLEFSRHDEGELPSKVSPEAPEAPLEEEKAAEEEAPAEVDAAPTVAEKEFPIPVAEEAEPD
jgi:hypothetical protein